MPYAKPVQKVTLRERYAGSEVWEDRIIAPKKDENREPAEILVVSVAVANGRGSVIVSNQGVIITSVRGVEQEYKFDF